MKFTLIAIILSALLSCGGSVKKTAPNQDVQKKTDVPPISSLLPADGAKFKSGDRIAMSVHLRGGVSADSIAIYISDRRYTAVNGEFTYDIPSSIRSGIIPWHAVAYAYGDSSLRSSAITVSDDYELVKYSYKIKNTYPHNAASYTQGLLWHDGYLYESIGLNGHSAILKVSLNDGGIVQRKDMKDDYFGEGMALVGEKLYQLTWKNGTAFIYDRSSFRTIGQFAYQGDGWGLTSDGNMLYMSDGSDKIYVVDPVNFRRTKTIRVSAEGDPVHNINELEWIEGEIWANIYTSSNIIRIDPSTGRVKGIVSLKGIMPQKDVTFDTDVLNGIAYDKQGKRIFVTGKNWSKLFEIEVIKN